MYKKFDNYENLPDDILTASVLVQDIQSIKPDSASELSLELFVKNKSLEIIPIVYDGLPVGVAQRKSLIERFALPFTRELPGKKAYYGFYE